MTKDLKKINQEQMVERVAQTGNMAEVAREFKVSREYVRQVVNRHFRKVVAETEIDTQARIDELERLLASVGMDDNWKDTVKKRLYELRNNQ